MNPPIQKTRGNQMDMFKNLFVCNQFGDSLPLGEFLQLPSAEKWKMSKGQFDIYDVLQRKLRALTKEEREEWTRYYEQKSEEKQREQKQRITTILRG
jgi:hypothetical protein